MAIKFYDVKKRKKVNVKEDNVWKTTYERPLRDGRLQIRYAFRAQYEQRWLTRFCTKADWDASLAPLQEEQPVH